MTKRLTLKEKRETAKALGNPARPLQQMIDWHNHPENPPEVVKRAVGVLRSPAMKAARTAAATSRKYTGVGEESG
jgi:hypothetical protein